MANARNNGRSGNTQKKSSGQKRTSSKSNSKKTTQKSAPKKNSANGKMYIEKQKAQDSSRQMSAIVLFAVSVFILCVTLIPGGNIWGALRGVFFGLFGVCAFVWPFVLMYVAIMISLDKPMGNLRYTVTVASILVIFISAAVNIFSSVDEITAWADYKDSITAAYETGLRSTNGGAVGAIIGGLLLWMFASKVPAGITICLLIFVTIMLLTGATLVGFFKSLWTPVEKGTKAAGEHYEVARKKIEEKRAMQQHRFNPDVDLGPEYEAQADEHAEALADELVKKAETVEPRKKKQNASDAPVSLETSEPASPSVLLDDIIKKAANKKVADAKSEQASREEAHDHESEISKEIENKTVSSEKDLGKKQYKFPPLTCLNPPKISVRGSSESELKDNAEKLVSVLRSFGVETTIVDICRGPSVTRYELSPAAGVRISRITGLADDIALSLAATGVRIEAPIPGKAAVGIEVPNKTRESVTLREILESKDYKSQVSKSKLTVALGKDITGNICTMDISKMPHLLVAGTTGSGKSVCLNAMILSILYNATPEEVKLVMIDPKQVEFTNYNGLPHLLIPVVTDPKKAAGALAWAVKEMLNRYKSFSENNVRDIKGYNELAKMDPEKNPMPQIVIFIDEFADLMMAASAEVEDSVCRLAQMARAAGMHLVIATQSPRVDVITGLIKANIPSRLSLKVSNGTDSRIILDMIGAEKLLGNGDMLFNPVGVSKPTRIQGCYVPDNEIHNVIDFIKQQEQSSYNEGVLEEIEKHAAASENSGKKSGGVDAPGGADDGDVLLSDAIEVVVNAGQASTTLIQRKLKVGYARAARIVDELEERGIVGPFEGSKPRRVLITKNQWLEMNAMSPSDGDEQNRVIIDESQSVDDES